MTVHPCCCVYSSTSFFYIPELYSGIVWIYPNLFICFITFRSYQDNAFVTWLLLVLKYLRFRDTFSEFELCTWKVLALCIFSCQKVIEFKQSLKSFELGDSERSGKHLWFLKRLSANLWPGLLFEFVFIRPCIYIYISSLS